MDKDRKKNEEKPKKNDFKAFLRKRAPIYLGLIAMFVVFVIPEFTKGDFRKVVFLNYQMKINKLLIF